jgi:hypothetical protein
MQLSTSDTLDRMNDTTTIRVDRATHRELQRIAARENVTITEAVSRAVRLLSQERMGKQLASPLTDEDRAWLDADFG